MPPLRKVTDLARILDVKPSTVYTLVSQDKIPHIRIGRLIRFTPEQINDFLRKRTRGSVQLRSSDPKAEEN
jgi:excisionase family DNA binding protein